MRRIRRLPAEELMPVVLGLADGILTALVFASAALLGTHRHLDAGLALRVSAAVAVTNAFVFFVARYSETRGGLVRAELQLSIRSPGGFARTRLGRVVLRDSTRETAVVCASSFVGASVPLGVAAVLPALPWAAFVIALGLLGVLGVALGSAVYGSALRWGGALLLGGAVLAAVGVKLRIV
jgi:hypothetical protein